MKILTQTRPDGTFKLVGLSECDTTCQKIWDHNYDHLVEANGIQKWKHMVNRPMGKVKKADLYCIGIPCKTASTAGKRGARDDATLHDIMAACVEYVEKKTPKFCFIEEVDNFALQFEDVCLMLVETLRSVKGPKGKSKYKIHSNIIDAKDVAGVPNSRRRFYLVGLRRDLTGQSKFGFCWPGNKPFQHQLDEYISPAHPDHDPWAS